MQHCTETLYNVGCHQHIDVFLQMTLWILQRANHYLSRAAVHVLKHKDQLTLDLKPNHTFTKESLVSESYVQNYFLAEEHHISAFPKTLVLLHIVHVVNTNTHLNTDQNFSTAHTSMTQFHDICLNTERD